MTNEVCEIVLKRSQLTDYEIDVLKARVIQLERKSKALNPQKPTANLELEVITQEMLIIEAKLEEAQKKIEDSNTRAFTQRSGFYVINGGK